ncbi:MAG: hypothetical protein LBP80_07270 [Treponema sp.]|jgi:hypothetical protein|nr:hypothetical protein [Treponema sp.]
MGSVFCRKDIKEPDMASARRTYWKTEEEDRKWLDFDKKTVKDKEPGDNKRGKGEETDDNKEPGDNKTTEEVKQPRKFFKERWEFLTAEFLVDFPYLHLKRYLIRRNYTHLAEHIPWDGDNENSFTLRSKTFINRLKCRIHIFAPKEMLEIEKNEAHIRLMNSLWYAAKSIRNISAAAFLAAAVFYIKRDFTALAGDPAAYIVSLVDSFIHIENNAQVPSCPPNFSHLLAFFLAVEFAIAFYIRRSIKQYFHYMRVREIVFILEIADTIGRVTGIDMFKELGQDKAPGQPAPANKGARS